MFVDGGRKNQLPEFPSMRSTRTGGPEHDVMRRPECVGLDAACSRRGLLIVLNRPSSIANEAM